MGVISTGRLTNSVLKLSIDTYLGVDVSRDSDSLVALVGVSVSGDTYQATCGTCPQVLGDDLSVMGNIGQVMGDTVLSTGGDHCLPVERKER